MSDIPKNIEDYFHTFPKETRKVLQTIREMIINEVPEAEEIISYKMPTFKLNGTYLIYYAAWRKHLSIYPIPQADAEFRREVSRFTAGKGTLKFPLNRPLPMLLIKKTIKYLIEDNKKGLVKKAVPR